jgi:hypothetical protein
LKHHIRAAAASAAIIWAVGSTSAADLPLGAFSPAATQAENSIVGSINSGSRLAMAPTSSEVRDSRVREFLRWRERSAASDRR